MSRIFAAAIALLLVGESMLAGQETGANGWIQLFNGRDLTGWTPKIKGYELGENFGNTFRVEDGVLKVSYDQYERFDNKFGHLFYKQPYSHYVVAAEYRFVGEQVRGAGGGLSWAVPEPAGIDGYPGHLTLLPDGRILCTYGFRRPPYAIRAVLSDDDGASWTTARPIAIRSGLPNRDLGYPCTVNTEDRLLSVYYARDEMGCTCIHATRWRLPEC